MRASERATIRSIVVAPSDIEESRLDRDIRIPSGKEGKLADELDDEEEEENQIALSVTTRALVERDERPLVMLLILISFSLCTTVETRARARARRVLYIHINIYIFLRGTINLIHTHVHNDVVLPLASHARDRKDEARLCDTYTRFQCTV